MACAAALWYAAVAAAVPDAAQQQHINTFEKAIADDPENLHLAADYRQLMIACDEFDRSTALFEKLAKRKGSGPNVQISLALAYVDKVPVSGNIRRLYLGRDAISALTRSIERGPSPLAYYVRGLINLYYNNFIFHRAHLGVGDLQTALAMTSDETPPALVERIWLALGDGYWRVENAAKARETWSAGAVRFPENAALTLRVAGDDRQVAAAVRRALNDNIRVDTSLRDIPRRVGDIQTAP